MRQGVPQPWHIGRSSTHAKGGVLNPDNRFLVFQLGAISAVILMAFMFSVLSQDSFAGPGVPVIQCATIGAIAAALGSLWMFRSMRKPLENPLVHALGNLAAGAGIGFWLIWSALQALPRLTATATQTYRVEYTRTDGWKNCRFGVAFDAPFLREHVKICGGRWGLSPDAPRGMLNVVAQTGPYGMYLQSITDTSIEVDPGGQPIRRCSANQGSSC